MGAYVIADINVTDPVQYEQYKKLSTLAMKAHGAEFCVRGGAVEVLEGDWQPERLVMARFASVAQARAFYNSAEYALAREARAGAAQMRMVIVEGL